MVCFVGHSSTASSMNSRMPQSSIFSSLVFHIWNYFWAISFKIFKYQVDVITLTSVSPMLTSPLIFRPECLITISNLTGSKKYSLFIISFLPQSCLSKWCTIAFIISAAPNLGAIFGSSISLNLLSKYSLTLANTHYLHCQTSSLSYHLLSSARASLLSPCFHLNPSCPFSALHKFKLNDTLGCFKSLHKTFQ